MRAARDAALGAAAPARPDGRQARVRPRARAARARCGSTANPSTRARCSRSSARGARSRRSRASATPAKLHPVQAAFVREDALQCGFCTPGMVMSCALRGAAARREASTRRPGSARRRPGNLCRCGTYPHVARGGARRGEGPVYALMPREGHDQGRACDGRRARVSRSEIHERRTRAPWGRDANLRLVGHRTSPRVDGPGEGHRRGAIRGRRATARDWRSRGSLLLAARARAGDGGRRDGRARGSGRARACGRSRATAREATRARPWRSCAPRRRTRSTTRSRRSSVAVRGAPGTR